MTSQHVTLQLYSTPSTVAIVCCAVLYCTVCVVSLLFLLFQMKQLRVNNFPPFFLKFYSPIVFFLLFVVSLFSFFFLLQFNSLTLFLVLVESVLQQLTNNYVINAQAITFYFLNFKMNSASSFRPVPSRLHRRKENNPKATATNSNNNLV